MPTPNVASCGHDEVMGQARSWHPVTADEMFYVNTNWGSGTLDAWLVTTQTNSLNWVMTLILRKKYSVIRASEQLDIRHHRLMATRSSMNSLKCQDFFGIIINLIGTTQASSRPPAEHTVRMHGPMKRQAVPTPRADHSYLVYDS